MSLKRKETDHFRPSQILTKSLKPPPPRNGWAHAAKSTFPFPQPHTGSAKSTPSRPYSNPAHLTKPTSSTQADKPNNLILAGYMAHEFLARGTILGDKLDPAKISSLSSKPASKADERYDEVSSLLRADGSHIAGIVNPTQLARYLMNR